MLKKYLWLLLFIALPLKAVHAQDDKKIKPRIATSDGFEEPQTGSARVILLKNGNTLFLNFSLKNGITVTLYGPDHKKKSQSGMEIEGFRQRALKNAELKGYFEADGNLLVFIEKQMGSELNLFRILISGTTGKKISETRIKTIENVSLMRLGVVEFSTMARSGFIVRKDPNSEYYAILTFNSFEKGNKRVHVSHYSPGNNLIRESFYDSPGKKFTFIDPVDLYVNKDHYVCLITYLFNTRRTGGKASAVGIAKLDAGDTDFQGSILEDSDDYTVKNVAMKLNSNNGSLYLVSRIDHRKKGKGAVNPNSNDILRFRRTKLLVNIIDPGKMKSTGSFLVTQDLLNQYVNKYLGYKHAYGGEIQDFLINEDNSITLLYEELDRKVHHHSYQSSGGSTQGGMDTYSTRLGEIGISILDTRGKELDAYAVPKAQITEGSVYEFNLYNRNQTDWKFRRKITRDEVMGYYSYDALQLGSNQILIYNDYIKNFNNERTNYRSIKNVKYVSETNTLFAIYDGKNIDRQFLFGEPGKKNSNFINMEMISKNRDNTGFATMMVEKRGKKKVAKVLWVDFK